MGTTLVNVGILNGRSTKLDSDDLYALAELVDNFSTDVVVTTPEIVLPSAIPGSDAAGSSADSNAVVGEAAVKLVGEVQTVSPGSKTAETPSESKQLRKNVDGASARADTPHMAIVLPKLNASLKTADSVARSEKIGTNETVTDSANGPSHESRTDAIQPKTKTAIEKAKQAAMETAMLAASDTIALSKSKLLAAPTRKSSEPSPADAKSVEAKTAAVKSVAEKSVAENLVDRAVVEGESTAVEPQAKPAASAAESVATNNERLKRDNLVVEEISSRLAEELAINLLQGEADQGVATHNIAVVPPSEKQYERLIDNLLEKTVPGLPGAMLITGCETNQRVGKVALNVAALLAERNLGKILLIDGDIVDKGLTDSLIDADAAGLTEVLNRQQGVMSVIKPTELKNLFFLPAGIVSLSRQKTLNSRLASFNEELKKEFRFVLIDGGAAREMMPKTWSAFCDSTYLVVSLGDTLNTTASSAVADLQSAGARLLGCVVTNLP